MGEQTQDGGYEQLLQLTSRLPFGAYQQEKLEVSMIPMQMKGIQLRHKLYPLFPKSREHQQGYVSKEPSIDNYIQLFRIIEMNHPGEDSSLKKIQEEILICLDEIGGMEGPERWIAFRDYIYLKLSDHIRKLCEILQKN